MSEMYLPDVERAAPAGERAEVLADLRERGLPVPPIFHLFAFKSDRTEHLMRFTQGVMRGPSPLSPGWRELIAAFTSRRNECPY